MILEASDDRWQHYWDLHVMAAVRLSRSLAPLMQARGGGVILNNASICATQPLYYEPIYNTTKAALVMFSKCLAHELIPHNIRVNTVNPWSGDDPGLAENGQDIDRRQGHHLGAISGQYCQRECADWSFATPQEVADFFVFLCSPRASYSVGSTYYVDGGWLNVVT